jgi:hypothetical protein
MFLEVDQNFQEKEEVMDENLFKNLLLSHISSKDHE